MFIWCDFFLDDFNQGRYLKLTPEIEDEYLSSSPAKRRDAQIEKSALEMKTKYEEKFTNQFLTMEVNSEVEVYGLTFFCPINDEINGGCMATMYFNRVEKGDDNKVNAIVLNGKSMEADADVDVTENEFRFCPKVVTEYGRYGNVSLWYIENATLPGEEPNTYIICDSDIFY